MHYAVRRSVLNSLPNDLGDVGSQVAQGLLATLDCVVLLDRLVAQLLGGNGRIPFGYERNEQKQRIHDERTAPVIRRIFTRYAAGRLGAAAIARRLVAEQAPAPSRGWQPNIVLWVL